MDASVLQLLLLLAFGLIGYFAGRSRPEKSDKEDQEPRKVRIKYAAFEIDGCTYEIGEKE